MASNPPPIILQSGNQPQHSIIWLHGLGADGQDFVPIAGELNLPVAVRYVFPHAPMRPVTINGGYVMRAWYDITQQPPSALTRTGSDAHQDAAGIRVSQAAVEVLIAQEVASGIAPGNIFLAGFSQGGAIVLHTGLRQATPLGGVLALSTYLPLAASAPDEMHAGTRATPIFMAHGRSDPVIPFKLGADSRDALQEFGYAVEWHEYAMQHSVCMEELRDIEVWLTRHLL
ncbi:MAG: carboxylesterase [Gallionellales bacterium RIFCSPLOWO2_02_FULL_57_47]|nr:MAG: carboxylesterase [Gallionellales bacterium RIFCSPLOWO2_02_FULL_57_47]OGT16417.1 MAG: carboxylesterase [Gallionellales bacterium RIFCSPHIGHO2_02_FULL_57_16]